MKFVLYIRQSWRSGVQWLTLEFSSREKAVAAGDQLVKEYEYVQNNVTLSYVSYTILEKD